VWLLYERIFKYLKVITLKKVDLDSNNNFTLSPGMCNSYLDSYISIAVKDKKHILLTTVIDGEPLAWITCDYAQLDSLINVLKGFQNRIK
jgi:hypothetical protein